MFKKYFAILIACTLLILTGCQTNKSAPSTNTQSPSASFPAKGTINNTPPPLQLKIIDADSKDVISYINRENWIKAESMAEEMKTAINDLKPLLKSVAISPSTIKNVESAITKLEKQVKTKKSYESRVQANTITSFIPDIADFYKTTVPTDLGRLSYYGREILLNVEKNDWTTAKSSLDSIQKIWSRLRPQLDSAYKNDGTQFDNSVKNLGDYIKKKDATLTNKESDIILNLIDQLETDFKNQK